MLYPDFNELVSLKEQKFSIRLGADRLVKATVAGDSHSPFRGQGLEFDSVRAYVPGDDVRNIDWRVTARTGIAHLKLFSEERERSVIIALDMNETMRFGTRNTFKSVQAARCGALLGWRALQEGNRLGACLFGDVPESIQFFKPNRGRHSLLAMLQLLSSPQKVCHKIALEESIKHLIFVAGHGTLIYLISDFMDIGENLHNQLALLSKKSDIVCIAVNDPWDAKLPFLGPITFQNALNEKMLINTDNHQGRKRYEDEFRKNREKLYELTLKCKCSLIELTTESSLVKELILGMKKIARGKRR